MNRASGPPVPANLVTLLPQGVQVGTAGLHNLRDRGCKKLPTDSGVYLVFVPDGCPVTFLEENPGGRSNGKDPTIAVASLRKQWRVLPGGVAYVGMASDLRHRARLLIGFGCGRPKAHWGGRCLWQIREVWKFGVVWYLHPRPAEEERRLLGEFRRLDGLPFANLRL